MSFNKTDFDKLDKRIQKITTTDVQKIVNNEGVPATNKLEDNNKVYETEATILFIDIRKSTLLTDMSKPQSMVKIYRSFMRTCVDCVRKNNGVTRQFLGDRIMGVFIDEKNENGDLICRGIDNALNAARTMQTCIDFSLNKNLKSNVNGKIIECGIGIDSGLILVTKVGMYGLEYDDEKDNETDCVWVGKITNYASKYSDIAKGGEILISEKVYNDIISIHQAKFKKTVNIKNGKTYTGYSTFNYYLDFKDELGSSVKLDATSMSITENDEQLSQIVDKFDSKYKDLINLEKDLAVEKERLNKDKELHYLKNMEMYNIFYKYLQKAHCDANYIEEKGYDFWIECIENYNIFGKRLGKSGETLENNILCYLAQIYDFYGFYEKALYYMNLMVTNSSWVHLKSKTIKWAKDNGKLFSIKYDLDKNIKDASSENEKENWQKYRNELDEILGGKK